MLPGDGHLMSVLDTYADQSFLDWIMGFFALVPAGFLLGVICALVAFAIFRSIGFLRRGN